MIDSTLLGLNWADYSIIGIIFLSTIISLARGFFREAFSLATWIFAFWVGFRYSAEVATYLINYIKTPTLSMIAAFAVVFIITIVIGGLANFLLSQIIVSSGLSGSDRALGVVFGLARGILLVGVILLFMTLTSFPSELWWKHSVIIPQFNGLIIWLEGFLPQKLTHIL